MDFSINEILEFDFIKYSKYFKDQDFGLNIAREILKINNIDKEPIRITEGSSLVFNIDEELFLKITPSFFYDSFNTELEITKLYKKFSYEIPDIFKFNSFENWNYLITKKVRGKQLYKVYKEFSFDDKLELAQQLGNIIYEISKINSFGFKRYFGTWNDLLNDRLKNQYKIHFEKGNSDYWCKEINNFIEEKKEKLLNLNNIVLVHADINLSHIIVEKTNDKWKLVGLLDLADSMNAPCEVEFILPFIDLFKGNYSLQKELLKFANYKQKYDNKEFSELLMALTLQNRFIAFHDWFSKEINSGIKNLRDLAKIVFPY